MTPLQALDVLLDAAERWGDRAESEVEEGYLTRDEANLDDLDIAFAQSGVIRSVLESAPIDIEEEE